MFDRKKYKKFAKMQLKSRWRVPVLMTLFSFLIIIAFQIPEILNDAKTFKDRDALYEFYEDNNLSLSITEQLQLSSLSIRETVTTILGWLVLFAEFSLLFAMQSVFVKMSHGPEPVNFSDFIEGLSLWAKGVVAGLWKTLWIFLWSLLFLFPGIVKYYAYSQTEYLLLEYPNLSVTKAMRISIAITNGHKGDLFIQDVSFLGWWILATIPLGIGNLWLFPYMSMTKVNSFHGLLKEAVSRGIVTREDFTN